MVLRCLAILVTASLCLAAPLPGRAIEPTPADQGPLRVLLVGNSYTRFNLLPTLLSRIASNVPDGPAMRVDAVAHGGYTLRRHWLKSEARSRIRFGNYTHVVLQDHSMRAIDKADEMAEYVARFADLISGRGARTILYETWARRADASLYRERPDIASPADMQQRIAGAYSRLAADHGARLAPVGTLFLESMQAHPELGLYRSDGAHPSIRGSYLAACAIYAAITGTDPAQTTYTPWGLSEPDARALRSLSGRGLHSPQAADASEMAATAAPAPDYR